ncbi:cyanophycin metabolism-associated ABC transporter [Pseudoduganella albidiflava]|uniref:ABC transporter n=1 Tax=Pseudoduganella albidiflava TaxID=321983 RepID=A0A411WYJ4_9BURK|nr:ABC transporter ATP-binding protein [Pseudoduganella albidiflava]QBI01758.1 ABC transporter ATP-binding protein [Pseudoduganella albidiflava]GGY39918.1 ABC transporter [Pseudoduganella albidiflava]
MTRTDLPPGLARIELPEHWRSDTQMQLAPGENVQSALEVDLDDKLHFAKGIVLLTDRRILSRAPGQGWQAWPYRQGMLLKLHDHAGVGHLELFDEHGRLAAWRFTLGQNLYAIKLAEAFTPLMEAALTGQPVARPEEHACPTCKAPLDPDQDECPICTKVVHTPPSTWTLLRLWRFAHPYRWPLAGGFTLMLLSTAAHMIPPYISMPLMDNVLIPYQNGQPVDTSLVTMYMSALLGSAILAWILGWGKTYVLALVSERIGADLRTSTYEHLLRLSLEYFGGKRTGDLMARIGSESDRICVFLSLHLLDFASDCLMIIMTGVILFTIDPWLALVTLVPLPFIAWLIHLVRDRLRTGFEKIDRVWGEVTNVLADTIPGIRVVKAFAQEAREAQRFRIANKHNLAVNDKLNKVWSLFSPTVSFLTEVGLLVIYVFGIFQVSQSHVTVGVLTAFLTYSTRFYSRLDSMSRIVSVTQKSASAAKRIFDILDHVSSVPEPANPVKLDKVEGNITLREVGFRYGNRAVNRGVNLEIKAGEMIGLVGHSGSGKSTLVNLICRFYDVAEGAILLDGVDIRSLAVSDYRRNIGLVLQEPFLFFGTIAENIAYGKPDASRAEIMAAARAAHAHDFILRLPQGYDSMVGERGQGLSGGERQRISIARALLIDPRILILDEATASVDSETEKEIQKALDNLVAGRTTIAIAHRLSTLQRANRLVVMDRGKVVEEGPHEELMANEGAYYRLYQAQARNVDTDLDDKDAQRDDDN